MFPNHVDLRKWRSQRAEAFNPVDTHELLWYHLLQKGLDRKTVWVDADSLRVGSQFCVLDGS